MPAGSRRSRTSPKGPRKGACRNPGVFLADLPSLAPGGRARRHAASARCRRGCRHNGPPGPLARGARLARPMGADAFPVRRRRTADPPRWANLNRRERPRPRASRTRPHLLLGESATRIVSGLGLRGGRGLSRAKRHRAVGPLDALPDRLVQRVLVVQVGVAEVHLRRLCRQRS